MKRYFYLFFVLSLLDLSTQAQTLMNVYLKNGNITQMDVAEIDSMTWTTIPPGTHEYVDLGLSVKWATCNVGASKPEDYGDYFAWGETKPKATYDWSTYKWCKGTSSTITKYCSYSVYSDHKTTLELLDDAAYVNWGGSWRMPTNAELDELRTQCTWTPTVQSGVNGCKVTGKNGNSIFLPASGVHLEDKIDSLNYMGWYWSSSLDVDYYEYCALCLNLPFPSRFDAYRCRGYSVRPVCPSNSPILVTSITLSLSSLEIQEGDTTSLKATIVPENATTQTLQWTSSDSTVVTVDTNGFVTGISAGNASITALATDGSGISAVCIVTVVESKSTKYVDLGLPSGLLWATCNVCASKPEDYGDYFAWGETEPKAIYNWDTYKDYPMPPVAYSSSTLHLSDDAANMNLGGGWRMPTSKEFDELKTNCTWRWTTHGDVNGYRISGTNGKFIFLPAAGCRDDSSSICVGSYGYYWTSTSYVDEFDYGLGGALFFDFNSGYIGFGRSRYFDGLCVRPVCLTDSFVSVTGIALSSDTLKLDECGTSVLSATVLPLTATRKVLDWTSSDTSVATVDEDGVVTAVDGGSAIITATATDGSGISAACVVTVKYTSYDYVDLGLSVCWATCNVGAASPAEYGDYFSWGETTPKTTYNWSTYKWCSGSSSTLTKYSNDSIYGIIDKKTTLDLEDDAAHVNWGGSWRMPTKDEQDELRTECTWTWTVKDDVFGYCVTGKNGNSIFLPAAGFYSITGLNEVDSEGNYWSSSLSTDGASNAYIIDFYSDDVEKYCGTRFCGRSVRPVFPSKNTPSEYYYTRK